MPSELAHQVAVVLRLELFDLRAGLLARQQDICRMRAGQLVAGLFGDESACCRMVDLDSVVDHFEEWLPAPQPVLQMVVCCAGHRSPEREIERLTAGGE